MFNKNDVREWIKTEHKDIFDNLNVKSVQNLKNEFLETLKNNYSNIRNIIDTGLKSNFLKVARINPEQKFSVIVKFTIYDLISIKNFSKIISEYSKEYNITLIEDDTLILSNNQLINWNNYQISNILKKFDISENNHHLEYILKNHGTIIKNMMAKHNIPSTFTLKFESKETIKEILFDDETYTNESNNYNKRPMNNISNDFDNVYRYLNNILSSLS